MEGFPNHPERSREHAERSGRRRGGVAGQRCLPAAGGRIPARAAGPLLPDARLRPGRRGPGPGDVSARLARLRRLRGPLVAALLALPHRYQRMPDRTPAQQPPLRARGPGDRERRRHRGTQPHR
ncbi:hypothetical protein SBRY_40594 [Actinacidiphila bryophytorum]|uniref:Uncharacterized protein n=1 Tax=Actinacidiphila bryophytorum TaxID=1436133 RepID=A0A9W4MH98_9ACTN|nr:hypothetical protein SBRY_40594 [Actinacidiphila bryophytorum]